MTDATIGGRFVAYQSLQCGDDCAGAEVRVLDVRSGRLRRSSKAGVGAFRLGGLVVKRNGAVAWIRAFLDRTAEVRKIEGAVETLVDRGDLELGSLALAGERLYWLRAGIAVSSTLR